MRKNNDVKTAKKGYKLVKGLFGKYEEIPKSWNIEKIDKIGKLVGGGTPNTANKQYWNGDILWAVPTDITKLQVNEIEDTERKITSQGLENSSANLLPSGAILITSRATIGKCAIAVKPISTNQGFQSIICNDEHSNLFIFYSMKHNYDQLLRLSYGTTFLEISKKEMRKISILMPNSTLEQTKIASILSGVDALIENTQKVVDKAENLKKGLMQRLLTKGIDHTKFKKVPWMFGKEIEIPKEWVVKILGNISNKIIDGTHFTPNYIEKGIPFLRVTDIHKFPIDWNSVKRISLEEHDDLTKRCNPEKNDILYSKNGTIGIVRLVDWETVFSCFVSLCLIKPKQDVITSNFLIHFLKTNLIKKQIIKRSKQLGVPNLHLEEIREFQILLPPLPEQQKIASILSGVDAYIQKNQQYKKSLEKLKKGLMQKLLTGQIRVKI